MLNRVRLKNFKLHADTNIDAAPITVFIGPNSSGKSSIFHSLLVWRQAAALGSVELIYDERTHRTWSAIDAYGHGWGQIIDIGEFDQIARRGEHEITLAIDSDIPPKERLPYLPGRIAGSFEVRIRDNRVVYQRGSLTFEFYSYTSSWSWAPPDGGRYSRSQVALPDLPTITLHASDSFSLLSTATPEIQSTAPLPPEKLIAVAELAAAICRSPLRALESIHPIFPLRGLEHPGYPLANRAASNLDRITLRDRTIALLSLLAYDRDIEKRMSAWLSELAGIKIEARLLPDKRVTILSSRVEEPIANHLFSNEGTGANQLPFILVPIGLTPPGETILLSEPEAHLHPRAQSHVTRLLMQLVKKERRQFFIETHSEHVLHALLNAVAKQEISASDLAIYYFENQHGTAKATRLQIDETGAIPGGLPGFFDQSLGELTEYLGALKNK